MLHNREKLLITSVFKLMLQLCVMFNITSPTPGAFWKKCYFLDVFSLDMSTLVPEVFFSLGATKLSGDGKSRSGEKKTSGTNG